MCRGRVVVAGAQRGRWRCGGGGAAAVDLVSLAQAEGGSETQWVVRAVLPTSIAHPACPCGWPRDPIGVPPPKVPSRLSFPPTSVTSLSCLCLLKPSPSFDSTGPLSRLVFLPFPQLTSSPSFIFAVLAQGHTVGTFWGLGFNPGEPAPPRCLTRPNPPPGASADTPFRVVWLWHLGLYDPMPRFPNL